MKQFQIYLSNNSEFKWASATNSIVTPMQTVVICYYFVIFIDLFIEAYLLVYTLTITKKVPSPKFKNIGTKRTITTPTKSKGFSRVI